jgi:hypothetical protein
MGYESWPTISALEDGGRNQSQEVRQPLDAGKGKEWIFYRVSRRKAVFQHFSFSSASTNLDF